MVFPFPGPPPSPDLLPFSPQASMQDLMSLQDPRQAEAEQIPSEKPKKAPPKPDESVVKSRITRTVAYWQQRDARMDEDQGLYDLATSSGTDGQVIVKNTPKIIIDKVAEMLGHEDPVQRIIPPREIDRKLAQKGSAYLRWYWDELNRRWCETVNPPLYYSLVHYGALRGWIVGRIQFDPDAGPEDPPTLMIPHDARQVYPMFNANMRGLRWVIHRQTMTYAEVMSEWEEAEKLFADQDEDSTVEVDAYYDSHWSAVYADGEEIVPLKAHEYGFVPWEIQIVYGTSIRATTNDKTNWPRNVGPSILEPIKKSYMKMNEVLSQMADEVARSSNPPLLYFYDPARPDEPPKIDIDSGGTTHLIYDRERVEPLRVGPTPMDATPLLNALVDDIEKGGLPSVLWAVSGDSTGFALSLLQGSARDKLYPLKTAMERFIEGVNRKSMMLVRDLHDSEVGFFVKDIETGDWVSGETISPEEIADIGIKCHVEYQDIAPKDRIALANLAALLTDKKLISLETARTEYLGLKDAEKENDKVMHDLIYLDEKVVKNVLILKALERTDPELAAIYQQSQMQEQMAPPQQPQAPQIPGMPSNVVPPPMQGGMDLLAQAAASSAGGIGMQRPEGIPGAGALPVRPPLIPGVI